MILCQELGRQATLSTGLMFGGQKLGECRHCRTGGLIHVSKHGNEGQGAVDGLGWVGSSTWRKAKIAQSPKLFVFNNRDRLFFWKR